jgi:hypothetical protein
MQFRYHQPTDICLLLLRLMEIYFPGGHHIHCWAGPKISGAGAKVENRTYNHQNSYLYM